MTSILENGLFAKAFPCQLYPKIKSFSLDILLADNDPAPVSPIHHFEKAGIMIDRQIVTCNVRSVYEGVYQTISDILEDKINVPTEYYIKDSDVEKWRRKRNRIPANEKIPKCRKHRYFTFPDQIDRPSRTIMTQEGGRSPNWNTHVIITSEGHHRRLLPVELERLNLFPDNHTEGIIASNRAFLMGNALVIGVVERIGLLQLAKEILSEAAIE